MKRFDYLVPTTLDEALSMLASRPEAKPVAGGTNILVQIKEGHRHEQALLSLNQLSELRRIRHDGRYLYLGATANMKEIAANPLIRAEFAALSTAAGILGSVQTRNMATVGGNLCNGSPSADTASPLLAHDAEAVIVSRDGQRLLPLAEFWLSPGVTALRPGELLREIRVPRPAPRTGSCYVRHIPRSAMDISVAGAAAVISLENGAVRQVRIALGAVAPTPLRAVKAEAILAGQPPTAERIALAAESAAAECQPLDDIRASAEYRRYLISVLAAQAVQGALDSAAVHKKDVAS